MFKPRMPEQFEMDSAKVLLGHPADPTVVAITQVMKNFALCYEPDSVQRSATERYRFAYWCAAELRSFLCKDAPPSVALQAKDAIEEMLGKWYRMEGCRCPDPDCLVCKDNARTRKKLAQASATLNDYLKGRTDA